MRRANRRAIARRKQHRHAVRNLDDAHATRCSRDRSVRARLRHTRLPHIKIRHLNPMHLLQPNRLGGQAQPLPHPAPILRNRVPGVTNMRPQVE
jgi:hypothetical protein